MTKIHYRKRFLLGLFTALRVLVSYKLLNLAAFFRSYEWKATYLKKLHRENAILIREKAIEMKGVMIKVGQFLSSRVDFLPDEYITELSRLQDQVPPHDYAGIRAQIIQALEAPPESIFSLFEEDPIAAASLGQVHRAELKDGRQVAVKIQYPDLEKVIETDIRMFGVLIRLLRGRYGNINLRVLHEEFSGIIRAELDYIQEGRNAERFAENFRDDARVIIPEVIWDYTRKTVLTLEFVAGLKITECDLEKHPEIDCKETVNLLAETYSKMIFLHGFFHGDPHPGNIFVREGPKLVFVDFGMVQAIAPSIKRGLRSFADAVVESNTPKIIESMERMGFITEGADYGALNRVTQSLIDKYRNITPSELKALTVDDISAEIESVFTVIKYLQIPNNFILLGRTIGILNGLAFKLNPEVNIIEIGKPYIKEFLGGSADERRRQFFRTVREWVTDLWDFPIQIQEFIKKANRGDLSFRLSRAEVGDITGQVRTLTNVMMLVVLTVTSATIALFLIINGNHLLSLLAAGAAAVLGLFSVFRLMRG